MSHFDAGYKYYFSKVKSSKGSFNTAKGVEAYLAKQGYAGTLDLPPSMLHTPSVRERYERAKTVKAEFEAGIEKAQEDHLNRYTEGYVPYKKVKGFTGGYDNPRAWDKMPEGIRKDRLLKAFMEGWATGKRVEKRNPEEIHGKYPDGIWLIRTYPAGPYSKLKESSIDTEHYWDMQDALERFKDAEWDTANIRLGTGFGKGMGKVIKKLARQNSNPGVADEGQDDHMEQAREVFEEFHGYPSEGESSVAEREIYRDELAQLGSLEELEVCTPDGRKLVPIGFDHHTKLCVSIDKKQLYFVGGDQELDVDGLVKAGLVDESEAEKDVIAVGEVKTISYFAKKVHLQGPKKAVPYIHEFGEDNGVLPSLVYDRLNKRCSLAGGSYTVEDVGIKN